MACPRFWLESETRIEELTVYETPQRFYLVGTVCDSPDTAHVARVDRSDVYTVNLMEDGHRYTLAEVASTMAAVGAKLVCVGTGLLGFVRFLQGWYMLVIMARRQVGVVGGHRIFAVEDSTVIALGNASKEEHERTRADEQRYKRLFFGIDLTSFYFSYSYNLTRTLQSNMVEHIHEADEKFCWNWYLSAPIRAQLSPKWFLPVVQGYVGSFTYAAFFDQTVRFTLVSRRSAYYAGTRYLKRGICDAGHVANDVETEQIVQQLRAVQDGHRAHFSSFVQTRGSIPLYWAQENTFAIPKPDITVYRSDPFHDAAIRHFQDTFARYGAPVILLNLIKHHEKRPRETLLLDGYADVVATVNASLPRGVKLDYIAWDFHAHKKKGQVALSLVPLARESLDKTGFFHSGVWNGLPLQRREQQQPQPPPRGMLADWAGLNALHQRGQLQHGVLRSNCIDSLDRTNASQFCIGVAALGEQLYAMGLVGEPVLEYQSQLVALLLTLYEEMGDAIAVQYAGSLLAHRMNSSSTKWSTVSKDVMTSIRRYYTSTFTDAEKQCSINLFLGRYLPYQQAPGAEPLWALPTDVMLHCAPRPHTRPLWATDWWSAPLARYAAMRDLALSRVPAPPPPPLLALGAPRLRAAPGVDLVYSSQVSPLFSSAYSATRLSSFDTVLSKRFLEVHRDHTAAASQHDSNKSPTKLASRTDEGAKQTTTTTTTPEYASYLATLANWVQGGRAGGPRRSLSSGPESRPPPPLTTPPAPVPVMPEPLFIVGPARVEKYEQYVRYPAELVWDGGSGERQRMASYLAKCLDTALVVLSPDFLPSKSFYSAYLMDAETFSFQASYDSLHVYKDHIQSCEGKELDHVPLDQLAEDDFATLFASATQKFDGRAHPLARTL